MPDWLQISEVIATETGTGIDLALTASGATAAAGAPPFTNWTSSSPAYAIDGFGPAPFPFMYHPGPGAGSGPEQHLVVTLASPSELDSLAIFGRTDGCCSHRDIYNVELYDENGSLLHALFNLDATGQSHSAFALLPDTSVTESVPEPAGLAMFALGLAGLGYARRRKSA